VLGRGAKRGEVDRARAEAPLAVAGLLRATAFDGVSLRDSKVKAVPNAFEKRDKPRVYLRWGLELAQFGDGLRSEQARSFHGAVGKNNVCTSATQAEQAFQKALIVIQPAILRGSFEHGVFSAHLVRGYR